MVVVLVALNMSATAVAKEREDGTLDLLLTTPITPAAYLGGKVRGMIAYLLPLLGVPVGTLLLAGLYVGSVTGGLIARSGGGGIVTHNAPIASAGMPNATLAVPAVLPEAGIVLAIVAVPFLAFCCMVGLQSSLKSKGSIGSVVGTVGIVGVVGGIISLCAWQSGKEITLVGPLLTSLSPATVALAGVYSESALAESVQSSGSLDGARVAMLIGALLSAGVFIAVVYGLRASMVHNFDMTVRRLAGTA